MANLCHCCCLVAKSPLTLWDPIHCSQPGSSVHVISQARMEWVAISFSKGSFWIKNQTRVSCVAGRLFTNWAMREAPVMWIALWKGRHGREFGSPVNSQWWPETSQHPCEWAWRWELPSQALTWDPTPDPHLEGSFLRNWVNHPAYLWFTVH